MSQIINEIGNKYGLLTVIDRAPSRNGRAYWLCKCECGRQKEILGRNLRIGNTITCGDKVHKQDRCKEIGRSNKIDLTGQEFGKLTALYPIGSANYGGVLWKCQCRCGNLHIVEASNLKNGKVLSCGCLVSKGEQKIQEILNKYNIDFQTQYTPKNFILSTGYKPYFDFAIFKDNQLKCLIEYHGEQHYHYYTNKNTWNNKENYEKVKRRDKEKEELCKLYNIELYKISYLNFDKIEKILYNILQSKGLL